MEWCSHCQRSCVEVCMFGFISCPTCGKVLAEVGVRKSSYLIKARQKRMKRVKKEKEEEKKKKKKKPADATEPDGSSCSSSPSTPESKVNPTECSQKATDKNQNIQRCSQRKSNTRMMWCSHCLEFCRTELCGDAICCSFCGKLLESVIPRRNSF